MASLLVHITHGPEAPTRAALGCLVARAAIDDGHDVTLFLAGDAAYLLKDAVGASVAGVGTGDLGESLAALTGAGVEIHVSGGSSQARGVTEDDLTGKNARFASPNDLVRLTFDAERVLVY
jgi:uncharacterized protein